MRRTFLNLLSAMTSLREQWQRSVLSAVGVMVGAVAIVLLVSIAKGVQADITDQVKDIGVNILIVIPGRIDESGFSPNMIGQSLLTEDDARRLASVPGVTNVAEWSFVGGGVQYQGKLAQSLLIASTPSWFQMHPMTMQSGRLFGQSEDETAVCILGSIARNQLFPGIDPVGKKVTINAHSYEVIGVTKDRGAEQSLFSMGSLQNAVYIPYHQLLKVQPSAQTNRILIQMQPSVEPKGLIRKLDATLAQRLDRQQFQVITEEDLLGLVYKVMGILTWLLTGLTSIALFVGGVGIMTVMLMAVNERSKEIGIRKAVGARSSDLFVQFLAEAAAIALAGGVAGLILSYVVCLALAAWTPIKPLITTSTILLAFGVCVAIGAIFGLIPAMKAARRDPVGALRNE